MATEIFTDTSAWVALVDQHDSLHSTMVNFYPQLLSDWRIWVSTNLVIAESYTLIRARSTYNASMQFLTLLENSRRLLKIYSDTSIDGQAEAILRRYKDQDFSYVDAVSFAVMKNRGIAAALTFDHHFATAGFNRVI